MAQAKSPKGLKLIHELNSTTQNFSARQTRQSLRVSLGACTRRNLNRYSGIDLMVLRMWRDKIGARLTAWGNSYGCPRISQLVCASKSASFKFMQVSKLCPLFLSVLKLQYFSVVFPIALKPSSVPTNFIQFSSYVALHNLLSCSTRDSLSFFLEDTLGF